MPSFWRLARAAQLALLLPPAHQAADPTSPACPAAVLKLSPLPHTFVAQEGQHCQLDAGWVIAFPAPVTEANALRRPAEMLAAGIQARAGLRLNVVSQPDPASKVITLQLAPTPPPPPGASATTTMPHAFGAIDEGYHLNISATTATMTATTVRGVQYAIQTFLQLLSGGGRAHACRIDDAPDLPVRGFYLDSRPSNGLNQSFFAELAAMMGGLKMNSLILHNAAFMELSGASSAPIKSSRLAELKNVSAILANHSIDMIAEVGPYYSFGSFEGLWVRDERFQFTDTAGLAQPMKPALDPTTIGPRNPAFRPSSTAGGQVDGWQFKGYGHDSPSPCHVDATTHSPSGGRTVRCDITKDPKGGHAGGIYSEPFPIEPQGFYYVQFWTKVNGTGRAPSLVMGGANDSTANFGKSLSDTKGKWVQMGGTFVSPLDSSCTSNCFATIFSRFVGSGTVTWWIADIQVLRLNGALLNVIRTNATDVNVTSTTGSGKRYIQGVDFELLPPKTAPQHYDPPFLKLYQAGDEALSIRRLPGGSISPHEQVLVSYDFGTNMVGNAKPNDPVSIADPQHFMEAKAAVDMIMQQFPAPAVFFYETDEVRGINRDSRSAKLGLSNAELLALDMNTLAGFVRANNPSVMPLFWGDMIHPLHNGGSLDYQRSYGGKRGATESAGASLAHDIGLVPWWYTRPSTDTRATPVMIASRGFWANYSLQWMAGTGGSLENNQAWVEQELGGGGGLGLINTQWSETPVLGGLAPAAEVTWNSKGVVNCSTLLAVKSDDAAASHQACAIVDISTGAASLHEAQQQAREATSPCAIVQLGRRSFQLTEPLVLTSADANTQWVGQGAEITTGYDVPLEAWTPVSANGAAAVQANVSRLVNRSHWGKFTLSNGLEDGHLSLLIKWHGVWRPMTVARWPNVPFEYRDSPPVNWTTVAATDCAPSNGSCLEFTWAADTDRPAQWVSAAKEGRLFLHGFFAALWEDSRGQIQEVDVASRQLRSTAVNPQQTGGVNNESVFYAYGMHEELDAPGEYILRNNMGMLSAVLPAECMGADGSVVCQTRLLPDIRKLHFQDCLIVGHAYLTSLNCSMAGVIQVIGTDNITLRGLNISGSFGTGVTVMGGTNITIDSCGIDNHNEGVVVGTLANTNKTSSNVSLLHSEIGFTRGASSRWIGGNRTVLTPSGFLIESNRFHDFGLYKYVISPGVVVGGVGTVVRKNEFRSPSHGQSEQAWLCYSCSLDILSDM